MVDDLTALLKEAGVRPTLDLGRNITHPCTFCATPAAPAHDLLDIGTYPDGSKLSRPVCDHCKRIVTARAQGGWLLDRLRCELDATTASMKRVERVLVDNGCECDCDHHFEEHDEDCDRCYGCKVEAAIRGVELWEPPELEVERQDDSEDAPP